MNPHSIYNTIRKNDKNNDYPVSLTEFLTKGVSYERDPQINNCDIKCINNLCENKYSETIKSTFSKLNGNKKYAYYVFETMQTSYCDKIGKLVNYNRCVQVDKQAIINELIELI